LFKLTVKITKTVDTQIIISAAGNIRFSNYFKAFHAESHNHNSKILEEDLLVTLLARSRAENTTHCSKTTKKVP
jgi:hypothetical protein